MRSQPDCLPNHYKEILEIIRRLKAENQLSLAKTLEDQLAAGATSTEILMSVSYELLRTVFKRRVSWRLRKDMFLLSWKIDNTIKQI